jgi:NAD-reducing hydrogenase large subunit
VVADGLSEDDYAAFLGEAVESWSYLKFPYYKPLGRCRAGRLPRPQWH